MAWLLHCFLLNDTPTAPPLLHPSTPSLKSPIQGTVSLPDPNVYRIHINRRPLLHEVPEHHAPYVMGSLIESGKVFVLNKISITNLLERGQKYVDVGLADGKDWAEKVKAEIEHQMVELDYWLGLETDLKNVAHFYSGQWRRVVNGAAEPNPLWPTWIAQLERRMRDGQAGAEEWYAFFKQTTTALVVTIRANLCFEDSTVKISMREGARTELNTLLKALGAVDEAFDKMAAQLGVMHAKKYARHISEAAGDVDGRY